jgi:hypothetical protein
MHGPKKSACTSVFETDSYIHIYDQNDNKSPFLSYNPIPWRDSTSAGGDDTARPRRQGVEKSLIVTYLLVPRYNWMAT